MATTSGSHGVSGPTREPVPRAPIIFAIPLARVLLISEYFG